MRLPHLCLLRLIVLALFSMGIVAHSSAQTNLFDQASGANTYFGGFGNFNWVASWSGFLPTAGTQLFASANGNPTPFLNLGMSKNLGGVMNNQPYTVSLNTGYYYGSPIILSDYYQLYIGSALGTMNWTSTPVPAAPDVWYTWTGTYTPAAGDVGQPFFFYMRMDEPGNHSFVLDLSFNFVVLLELGEFKAEKSAADVQLHWRMPEGVQADQFRVERSADGRLFETVSEFGSHGGDLYSFTDEGAAQLPAHRLSYRIAIMDHNGTAQLSDVAVVNIEHDGSPLAVAWFDASSETIVVQQAGKAAPERITLHAANGMQVLSRPGAEGRIEILASAIPAGIYFITVEAAGRRQVLKINLIR